MSIKDYNMRYIIQNGTTNEIIKVPKLDEDEYIQTEITINELLLIRSIMKELKEIEAVVVSKSYMKD